jgi:aminoglycoside phosphotransferase (APT) family kinase protein
MKNKRFDRNDILAIIKKHKLGRISRISYSKSGMVNPCLFLDNKFVLRINVRDPEIKKFEREKIAFGKLKKEKFCPKKVFLSKDHKIIPYTYIITEKISGKEIAKDWKSFSKNKKAKISLQAGKILARIHQHKMPFFGDLVKGGEKGNFKSWDAFLFNYTKSKIAEAKKFKVLDKDTEKRILEKYREIKPLLKNVKSPFLLHDDFTLDNMVHENGKINGVFDFEWARAGDPEYELKDLKELDNEEFYKGYTSIHKLSKDFKNKIIFYKLISDLGLLPVAKKHWSAKSVKEIQTRVKIGLNKIDGECGRG